MSFVVKVVCGRWV
ncbi:hypothetical protein M2G54_21905 [Vibrio vulnificus]|nr:hypothetical protein [Vibrio vulnificus]